MAIDSARTRASETDNAKKKLPRLARVRAKQLNSKKNWRASHACERNSLSIKKKTLALARVRASALYCKIRTHACERKPTAKKMRSHACERRYTPAM